MTRLKLAISQVDEDPPSNTIGNRWLSSSKQSRVVLLRTYHHKEAAEYKTQCKGTRAERNTQQAV